MKLFISILFILTNLLFSTLAQISLVKDINLVPSSSMPLSANNRSFESINDKTIFLIQSNRNKFDLVSIDSTNHVTTPLLKLNYSIQKTIKFAKFNGFLYFFISHINANNELWRTDGTLEGTTKVKDNFGNTSEIIVYNNQMYFPVCP